MFLCEVWCGLSSQLVGSSDLEEFSDLPQAQNNSGRSIHILLSALSLLTLQQFQGCSTSLVAMPEQFFDVPTVIATVWITFLGFYIFWQSQTKPGYGTMDEESKDEF